MSEDKSTKVKGKAKIMYKDSPKIERSAEGKLHASKSPKPTKENKKEEHKGHGADLALHHKHSLERVELHQKHEKEHAAKKSHPEHHKAVMEMHAKREKEHQMLHSEHMDANASEGVGAEGAPGAEVAQTEQ